MPWSLPSFPTKQGLQALARLFVVAGLLVPLAVGAGVSCSLGNVYPDECESDTQCQDLFGLGSGCFEGYCDEPAGCSTGHDCRREFGGGACVNNVCVTHLPVHPSCTLLEPTSLRDTRLVGDQAPLIVGGMFRTEEASDGPRIAATFLAAREINGVSGLTAGRPIAVVTCDTGGPGNFLAGEGRRVQVREVVDYLAGTLGVPFVVGPITSSDALTAVGRVVAQRYPTVLISPSATSPALSYEPDRITEGDPYGMFWRTAASDEVQGRVLATDVVGKLPNDFPTVSRIAVVYIRDAYGEGLANVFKDNYADTILLPFEENADWAAVANNVVTNGATGVLVVSVDATTTRNFAQALVAVAPNMPFFLTDGSKDAQVFLAPDLPSELVAPVFNRTVGTAQADPQGPNYDFFAASLQQTFGVNPAGTSFVANAYDALYVGAYATLIASRAGPQYNGRDVAAGLASLRNGAPVVVGPGDWAAAKAAIGQFGQVSVTGISGDLDFDPTIGEAVSAVQVWRPVANCGANAPCFAEVAVIP